MLVTSRHCIDWEDQFWKVCLAFVVSNGTASAYWHYHYFKLCLPDILDWFFQIRTTTKIYTYSNKGSRMKSNIVFRVRRYGYDVGMIYFTMMPSFHATKLLCRCCAGAVSMFALNFSTTVAPRPHPPLFEQPALLFILGNFWEYQGFDPYLS